MGKHIETKRGLKTLLKRYLENGVSEGSYWHIVITQCIDMNLAMDESDYENTPKELKKLWRGLK